MLFAFMSVDEACFRLPWEARLMTDPTHSDMGILLGSKMVPVMGVRRLPQPTQRCLCTPSLVVPYLMQLCLIPSPSLSKGHPSKGRAMSLISSLLGLRSFYSFHSATVALAGLPTGLVK